MAARRGGSRERGRASERGQARDGAAKMGAREGERARGNGSTWAGISDGERRGRGKHGYRLSRDEGGESQRRILEDLLEADF